MMLFEVSAPVIERDTREFKQQNINRFPRLDNALFFFFNYKSYKLKEVKKHPNFQADQCCSQTDSCHEGFVADWTHLKITKQN